MKRSVTSWKLSERGLRGIFNLNRIFDLKLKSLDSRLTL